MIVREIIDAIKAEIEATPCYYDIKVKYCEKDQDLYRVIIDSSLIYSESGHMNIVLDDSFEGSAAWWAGPPKGHGDILSVVAEDEQITIRYANTYPPQKGGIIRLYPPQYLDGLLHIWQDKELSINSYDFISKISHPQQIDIEHLSGNRFPWLRERQADSLKLEGFSDSFLEGPPGTGKTTTLGILSAESLITRPNSKILLLSTTNHAVDQAILAVDKALADCKRQDLRNQIYRIGSRFISSNYVGREHLLPVIDPSLIKALTKAESERPDPSNIHAYNEWKKLIDSLRHEVRSQTKLILTKARLVAMTTTRAIFDLENLKMSTYDLVIFDEASQVGLAHALALVPLGRKRLYAGDPKQLSPIVKSERKEAKEWLGKSPFTFMKLNANNVCSLNEQSRMSETICELVSHVFYGGNLIVAKDCINNTKWINERTIHLENKNDEPHILIKNIEKDGIWSEKYKGPIRFESAETIINLLRKGIEQSSITEQQVIVLTPFRAQRALLKSMLFNAGLKKIKVSTVHRAQGSEAPIVIFDPVQASNNFLNGDEARKLINVALSRAQGKLVLLLSKYDYKNPLFFEISNIVKMSETKDDIVSIYELLKQPDFPICALNKIIKIKSNIGKVIEIIDNGKQFAIINISTGKRQVFIVESMKKALQN